MLDYPKGITLPEFNPNSKISFSAVEPEKTLTPQESLENNLSDNPELVELSEEELSRVGAEINSEYQKARQQALESQKRQIVGKDTDDMVLQGSVLEEVSKEGILGRLKNKFRNFQETGFNKEDDLNLKEEMKDLYDILINNKTDYSAPMTTKEKVVDALVQKVFKVLYPSASDVYTDGMTDFSRAQKNLNAELLENMDTLDEATKKALYNYGVKSDERGVYYNANSKISKKFAKSPEVKKFIDNKGYLSNKYKEAGHNFNFDAALKDIVLNPNKIDRFGSLQHAKMVGQYVDKDGRKYGKVIDNVDYAPRHVKHPFDMKNFINNHGYNMQEKDSFENYYIVMDILLDDTIEESKKKSLLQKILHK